jgi:hypothetical protein
LVLTQAVTVSCWINPAFGGAAQGLISKRSSTPTMLSASYGLRATNSLEWYYGDANFHAVSNSPLPSNGRFSHIAGTRGANREMSLYINGDGVAFAALTGDPADSSAYALRVGASSASGFEAYDGIIDEVRIESRERSSNWVWAVWCNSNPATHTNFCTYGAVTHQSLSGIAVLIQ